MLLPSTEWLLLSAAIGLYLYDSIVLLYANEAVVFPSGAERWRVAFGAENLQWRKRAVLLPNPLTPHRPLYRLTWAMERVASGAAGDPPARRFGALGPLVWIMAIAVFGLLPCALFSRWHDLLIVATLICFYTAALLAFVYLWRHRQRFHCSRRLFLHLLFESLTCPPFALNLIRHLALQQEQTAELVSACQRWQTPADWAMTRPLLIARLEDELSWADGHSRFAAGLRQAIAGLESSSPDKRLGRSANEGDAR